MSILDTLKRLVWSTRTEATAVKAAQLQNAPMPRGQAEATEGLSFCATLQLRTPLRVLLRHGETYRKSDGQQPKIAGEQWEGIWIPQSQLWTKLSIKPPPQVVASQIGPVVADNYVPFLIAIREIVEVDDSIENRIDHLHKMLAECEWQEYLDKHGGADAIIQYFFPPFMNLGTHLDTPNRIAATTDEALLSIKGIGPAKLKSIRERCAVIASNRDSNRLERVFR